MTQNDSHNLKGKRSSGSETILLCPVQVSLVMYVLYVFCARGALLKKYPPPGCDESFKPAPLTYLVHTVSLAGI